VSTLDERAREVIARTRMEAAKLPPEQARERRAQGKAELERLIDSRGPMLVAVPRVEFPTPPGTVGMRRYHEARSQR
jgi:hypothetical protein